MKNPDKIEHLYTWGEPFFNKKMWVMVGVCICGAEAKKTAKEKYGRYGNDKHRKSSDEPFVKMSFKTPSTSCTRTILPGERKKATRKKSKQMIFRANAIYNGAHVWLKAPWKQGVGGYLYQESKCKFCHTKKINKKPARGGGDRTYKVFHSGEWFLYGPPSDKRLKNIEKYSNIPPCPGPPDRAV